MPTPIKRLRPAPVLLFAALALLLILNLCGRLNTVRQPDAAGVRPSAVPGGLFSEFDAAAVAPGDPFRSVDAFTIRPDEKFKPIGCRARFRLASEGHFPLFFFYYRDNIAIASRSLWISPGDTDCLSTLQVPRTQEGHWSIDICLNNNLLLKTVSFEILKAPGAGRFRSLENRRNNP